MKKMIVLPGNILTVKFSKVVQEITVQRGTKQYLATHSNKLAIKKLLIIEQSLRELSGELLEIRDLCNEVADLQVNISTTLRKRIFIFFFQFHCHHLH